MKISRFQVMYQFQKIVRVSLSNPFCLHAVRLRQAQADTILKQEIFKLRRYQIPHLFKLQLYCFTLLMKN
jgi:hypothetical protein